MSVIGEKLGLTKMAVSNRIKRLKEEGVLIGARYIVNPMQVGQGYVVVCQVTCETSGAQQERIANQIAKLPGVQTVYLNFGPYDILFIARRTDNKGAKDLLYEVTQMQGIRNTLTTIPHTVIKESLKVTLDE